VPRPVQAATAGVANSSKNAASLVTRQPLIAVRSGTILAAITISARGSKVPYGFKPGALGNGSAATARFRSRLTPRGFPLGRAALEGTVLRVPCLSSDRGCATLVSALDCRRRGFGGPPLGDPDRQPRTPAASPTGAAEREAIASPTTRPSSHVGNVQTRSRCASRARVRARAVSRPSSSARPAFAVRLRRPSAPPAKRRRRSLFRPQT
jgi:hypothetical protein